jgi:hypothetical protein
MKSSIKIILVTFITGLTLGCASTRDVPLTVHSDPLGALILMQTGYKDGTQSDWILLGNSPVQITRNISTKNATTISLRVIKEGYFEQIKAWNIDDFLKEHKQQDRILWVPHLVESKASG